MTDGPVCKSDFVSIQPARYKGAMKSTRKNLFIFLVFFSATGSAAAQETMPWNSTKMLGGNEQDLGVELYAPSQYVRFGIFNKPSEESRSKPEFGIRSIKSLLREDILSFQRRRPNGHDENDTVPKDNPKNDGFQWGAAFKQSLLFLAVQHGYAMTQPKTRRALKGPFFKDYARSVKSLSGWADGGRFFTNYVAHPMQGSFMGFIQVQNDPNGSGQTFGRSAAYWKSRMKALAWSAAWSTQFEFGPISQASIGNVGEHGKQTYVDVVMTPAGGIGLLIAEDMLDKYVIRRLETRSKNYFLKIFFRTLLNPTRTMANVIQFKTPWYRDTGLR